MCVCVCDAGLGAEACFRPVYNTFLVIVIKYTAFSAVRGFELLWFKEEGGERDLIIMVIFI